MAAVTDQFLASRRDLLRGGGAIIVSLALGSAGSALAPNPPGGPPPQSPDQADVPALPPPPPTPPPPLPIRALAPPAPLSPCPPAASPGAAEGGMRVRGAAARARRGLWGWARGRMSGAVEELELGKGGGPNRQGAATNTGALSEARGWV